MNSSFTVQIEEDLTEEPVTVAEVKKYAKISNNVEDDLIAELITSARVLLEKYTGLSFGEKTIKCYFTNTDTEFELPYQPNAVVTECVNDDDDDVTYNTRGLEFIQMTANSANGLLVTYTAGYETCPEGLKLAIKKQVATDFENRENYVVGEYSGQLSNGAKYAADPYKRMTLFGI